MTILKNISFFKRLKPAGWLAFGIVLVLAIGLVGCFMQPLSQTLTPVAALMTPQPTWTSAPLATTQPTATPLPAGWRQSIGLDGQPYFEPPDAIAQQIKAIFQAVIDCNYVQDGQYSDAALVKLDKQTVCAQAQAQALPGVEVSLSNIRQLTQLGNVNPVECHDTRTCTIARAKLGLLGVLGYDAKMCQPAASPCVYHHIQFSGVEPYLIVHATLSLQEDGKWKISNLHTEVIPPPPSSP
jgi:hypothetical protein